MQLASVVDAIVCPDPRWLGQWGGRPTARLQQKDVEEPERDPWQGEQPDAKEGNDIADYNQDIDYEESEPTVKPDA